MAEKLTTTFLVQRNRAAWTTLRDKKGGEEIVEQVETPLEVSADAAVQDTELAAQLKARCSRVRGDITLVLPTNQVLMRVVELPSTDAEELRGMAELQIDKFSPFPTDQMCIGHEILTQTADKSRVLVAAVPRDAVDTTGNACFTAGILPRSIDVEVMGWIWLLRSQGLIAPVGRQVLLIIDEVGTELVVTQDGSPVLIRALGLTAASATETAADIAEEINYTLTTMETEWGASPVGAVSVFHGKEIGGEFLNALAAALPGIQINPSPLANLPPLTEGLARRVVEHRGSTLDMAPADWKASLISREERRRAMIIIGTILSVWALAMFGLFFYAHFVQDRQFMLKTAVGRLDKKAGEVRELQRQVQSLQRYADRTYSALESLREICTVMPQSEPELDSFNYEKFKSISLRGTATGTGPIDEFMGKLQATKFFPKVDPGQTTTVVKNGQPRSQFKATISLPEEKKPEEKKK